MSDRTGWSTYQGSSTVTPPIFRDAGYFSRRLSYAASILPALVGTGVIAGWYLNIPTLTQLAPSLSSMKLNTALCLTLIGIAVWLQAPLEISALRRWRSRIAAGLAGLVSGLTLMEYIFRTNLGIDQLLVQDAGNPNFPGRPGINTATALFSLALAMLCLEWKGKITRFASLALAAIGIWLSLLALLGYVYSPFASRGLASYTGMAIHTALCILLLGVGVISLRPIPGLALLRQEPEVSQILVRKLMVMMLVGPIFIGWLALWGERLGLYPNIYRMVIMAGSLSTLLAICTYYSSLCIAELTARQRAIEDKLRLGEARLRAILDNEPACVKLLASDCRLLEMNRSGLAMIEADTPDQVVGQSVLAMIDAPYRQGFQRLTTQVFEGRPGVLQFQATGLRGSRIWLETMATPLRDDNGSVESALGITRDITQQKIAEEALRASEKKFISIFNSSPDAITISEIESGIYVEANRAFLEMTGYSREEVVGRTILQLGIWTEPQLRQHLGRLLQTYGVVRSFDAEFRRKNGKVIATQLSAEVIEVDGVKCFLVITRDVSEKKSLEQQLRQAQKMEAIGQLAGGIAHDFNNMLMIMLSYAELISGADKVSPTVADYASRILKAGQSAGSITRQLLAFSRKQVMEFKIQSLNSVVGELGKMLPRLLGEQIQVEYMLDANLPPIKLDRGQMEQVLVNLAVNARDAMPNGGKLTIATGTKEFDRSYADIHPAARLGRFAMLSVTDTGTGMDRDTQARIFEPFFTTKGVGKGTGLGLATVYGIVKQSNGFIWVYSEPGKGTAFKIYLPIEGGKLDDSAPLELESVPEQGTETVLLVEDERDVRDAINEYLSGCGYKVIAARDADEALGVCNSLSPAPDVVLTDVVMPGELGGPDLVVALRKLFPGIKSILMSGYTDRSINATNADAFIGKPISLRELNLRIRQLMNGRSQT
ncbi:MAG TPA: PAS domain S-box protein [Candidatus Acidoferrum sp.]|nr:PAS domain S-box protein [Candidatus Acidoferrum sp.]